MPKCPAGPKKRRVKKPHKRKMPSTSYYRTSHKGHTWKDHGTERRCSMCGRRPG